jgi:hypothetical protein
LTTLEAEILEARALLARLEEADLVRLALRVCPGEVWSDLLKRMVRAELVRRRRGNVNDDEKRPVR